MDKIILVGAGGHAGSCIDVIELSGQYKIAGLIEKDKASNQERFGYPVIGTDNDLQDIRQIYKNALITVGQIKTPVTRIHLYNLLRGMDYTLPVIISPSAYVSKNAHIGEGTIVFHDVIINANARVGSNCIINNKALVEHDTVIGNHCHIATGAIVNGDVTVGKESFVGSGVVTKQCISIGNNCVIGAGVVLKNNVKSKQIIKN